MFKVSFSADRYTTESLEEGIAEESGFVDLDWNRHQIMPEGDEKFEEFDTRAEAEQHIMDSIGSVEPSGDNYYAIDPDIDTNGDSWSYCGHIEEV